MTTSQIAHMSVYPRLKNTNKDDNKRGKAFCVQVEFNEFKSEKETLVLLHGYLGSLNDWKPAFARLDKQYNLIAVELRGHGSSDYPLDEDASWSMTDLAKDVVDVVQIITPETKFSIMASSMSTAISIEIARLYPDLVEKLFLMSPTTKFHIPFWVKLVLGIGRITPMKLAEGIVDVITSIIPKFANEHEKEFWDEGIDRFQGIELEIHQKILSEALSKWEVENLEIGQPIFIIAGKLDKVVPYNQTLELLELLPNASLLSLEDGEHHLIRKEKDIVFDLIFQWMEDADSILKQKYYEESDLEIIDNKLRLKQNVVLNQNLAKV